MKWIKVREGTYKCVDDSDPRPPVQLPNKKLSHSISTPYIPPWRQYEPGMWGEDNTTARKQADAFMAEREHQIKNDPRAARWEKSRKERWAKDKPWWVKHQKGES